MLQSLSGSYESRILSPEDSHHFSKPLRARSSHEQARIRIALQKVYLDWFENWCLVGAGDESNALIHIENVSTVQSNDILGAPDTLFDLLFGNAASGADADGSKVSRKGEMVAEVLRMAWEAWLVVVGQAIGRAQPLHVNSQAIPPSDQAVSQIWSGALDAVFIFGSESWRLHLSPSEVDFVLRATETEVNPGPLAIDEALSSLGDALSLRILSVCVELNPLTLSIEQVQSLAAGDIVILPHALDQPAQLKIDANEILDAGAGEDSAPLCHAWLGQFQGKMAVELQPTF